MTPYRRLRLIFFLTLVAFATLIAPSILRAAPPPGIPDGWSDGFVYANGVRIHYYHAVTAPGKPVIVMVHGVTDNGLCWTTLTWKLQHDYDVYMLDTRGHGLSDPFASADNGDTLIKDAVEAVHALKLEKPILLGHSMGAATVMRIGAEYPDLARRIVMLDPLVGPGGFGGRRGPGRQGAPTNAAASSAIGTNAIARGKGDGAPPMRQPRGGPAPGGLSVNMFGSPEALVAQNNYSYNDLVAKARRENPLWDMVDCQYWALSKKQFHGAYGSEGSQAMNGAMNTGDSLAKITVPALILKAGAGASAETRQAMQNWVSGFKNVKLVYIDDAHHNLHHDQLKRTVEELTAFLSTL